MADDIIFNEHNKDEFPPAHTAEHLLNQTMIRIFGCERSFNAHIERKKSKMSFHLNQKPTRQQEKEIERRMNELIDEDLPVTFEVVSRYDLPDDVSADRLPEDASDAVRLVRIGDYDVSRFFRNKRCEMPAFPSGRQNAEGKATGQDSLHSPDTQDQAMT